MNKPEVKLMISLFPPVRPSETLDTLLRIVFEDGFSGGSTDILGVILESMIKPKAT